MRSLISLFSAALVSTAALSPAIADDDSGVAGHFQVRVRAVAVEPEPSAKITLSGNDVGGTTTITDSVVPEIDGTYFITDNIGVELIAATTKHTASNSNTGPIASVWLLPPTLTAQYHFMPDSWIRPYVGAGINYTIFYDTRSAIPDLKFGDRFGWALQAGLDAPIPNTPYFVNFDIKKLFLSTNVKGLAGALKANVDIDPWLVGLGVGIRF
ncbi:MAG TPA: OmpW family outer membrane protein [Rhizomicrobium sp.]|nr:OmpW family outer membrane protein [Rhizomicrobium sp.]